MRGFQGAAKALTSERERLNIAEVRNLPDGARTMLSWSRCGRHSGALTVTVDLEALVLTYTAAGSAPWGQRIGLDRVPCPFGGSRPWFACPACGRHCGTLFLGRYGFTCRRCADLNYRSTRERPMYKSVNRADKIRARLGWVPGVAFGHGPKPAGMHWVTFWRLVAEHDRHVGAWIAALDASPLLRGLRPNLGRARDAAGNN